jgi:hypothetical protein
VPWLGVSLEVGRLPIRAVKGDRGMIQWEHWWTKVALPILQSKSERDPWPQLVEGNYSYMKRFAIPVPEWTRRLPGNQDDVAWNTRLILEEDLRCTCDATPGLELVDILVNAVRRALVGNLKSEGFGSIASLMMTDRRKCLHLLALSKEKQGRQKSPYDPIILKYFKKGGRSILLPRR